MKTEEVSVGSYYFENWKKDFPHQQISAFQELLNGIEIKLPPRSSEEVKKAKKMADGNDGQEIFDF